MARAEKSGRGHSAHGLDPTVQHERALSRLHREYERRIMNNMHRAEYVECLVAGLLGPSGPYPGWTSTTGHPGTRPQVQAISSGLPDSGRGAVQGRNGRRQNETGITTS